MTKPRPLPIELQTLREGKESNLQNSMWRQFKESTEFDAKWYPGNGGCIQRVLEAASLALATLMK